MGSRNTLKISVPNPCHQKWDEMGFINDHARHCESCDKVIVNFAAMSDAELIAYFNRNEVSCGRFAVHQLNRNITEQQKKKRWYAAMLLPALLTFSEAGAQDAPVEPRTEQTDSARSDVKIQIDALPVFKDSLQVIGRVLETNDSLANVPMSGAELIFHVGMRTQSCRSDEYGKFRIAFDTAKYEDTVQVEIRCADQTARFSSVILRREVLLSEVVIRETHGSRDRYVVGELPVRSVQVVERGPFRSWLWRLFHPRAWFRRD